MQLRISETKSHLTARSLNQPPCNHCQALELLQKNFRFRKALRSDNEVAVSTFLGTPSRLA